MSMLEPEEVPKVPEKDIDELFDDFKEDPDSKGMGEK